jgi:uncharacterized protein YndB with AHSA1/START domain
MMERKTYALTVTKQISASPEAIWGTWKDPELYVAIHDSHQAELDFRVGGSIQVRFFADKEGGETFIYDVIEPNKILAFHWEGHPEQRATVELIPAGEATEMRITQACGDEPEWLNNALLGWAWILDSTEAYFSTGKGLGNTAWVKDHGTHSVTRLEKD